MASTVLNSPCTVGAAKFDYVGLKQTAVGNHKFLYSRPSSASVKQRRSTNFTIRASEKHHDGPIKKLGLSDAECEAAVVAGNVPEAPPIPPKPAAPSGTPVVPSLVSFQIYKLIFLLLLLLLLWFLVSVFAC